MAVSKAKKEEILAQIEENLKGASSVAFTSNTKLSVVEISSLRKDLREVDAKFMLAKKTLIKIAFKKVYGIELSDEMLDGQVALLISNGDKIAGLSIVAKHANEHKKQEKIKFVGAYIDEEMYDSEGATKLASIPSKDILLSKLLGSMMSPLSSLARFFDGAKKELEAKSLEKVGDLVGATETPKEEVKTEEKPAEEAKTEEAPKEEVKTEEKPAE